MMDYSVTPLFAIPLYSASLGSLDIKTKQYIKNLDYERMPSNNGFYSVNKNILDVQECVALKSKIQSHIDNLMYEILNCDIKQSFEIQNSWVNRHEIGDWAASHRHNNSIISGVYYIEVDSLSGHIQFEKDRSYYNLWTDTVSVEMNSDNDKLNFFNAEAWAINPKNNDLILFPSHLYHSVSENQSSKERYSLAFNVFPRGVLGNKLNTLRL